MSSMENSEKTPCVSIETIAKELSRVPMAIVGNPQHGKTTLAKHLAKALRKISNVKVRVWDSSTKWLFNSPLERIYVNSTAFNSGLLRYRRLST